MKPILMIHEFRERFLDLPLEDYILTFDDGLYTQYVFLEELKKIKTEKYFFISSGIVCPEKLNQSVELICSEKAHKKAFEGNYTNYMKWSQIKEIDMIDSCFIGCHSHFHNIRTADNLKQIIYDIRYMQNVFSKELRYIPEHFCYPYNKRTKLYEMLLRSKGFKNFYGNERVDIDEL